MIFSEKLQLEYPTDSILRLITFISALMTIHQHGYVHLDLKEASLSKDRPQASMQEIGERCFDILDDYNLAEE